MTQVSGKPPGQIRVDGGASRNDFLMQFQADILGLPVVRPVITESTALGAAFLAGIGCGLWSKQQVSELVKIDRRFDPEAAETDRQLLYTRWKEAVKRARGWEQN